MNHTPGPWLGTQPAQGFATITDSDGNIVFGVAYPSLALGDKARPSEECEANFRLLLAAPKMLKALKIQREELNRIKGYVSCRNNETAMDVLGIALVEVTRAIADTEAL